MLLKVREALGYLIPAADRSGQNLESMDSGRRLHGEMRGLGWQYLSISGCFG